MKKILIPVMAVAIFGACNSDVKDNTADRQIKLLTDSATFTNNNMYSDSVRASATENIPEEVVTHPVVQQRPKATPRPQAPARPVVQSPQPTPPTQPVPQPEPVSPPVVAEGPASGGNPSAGNTEVVAPQEEKKGWNKATQGAVIGGAAGAVGGAIISKKKGVGAIVGGAVGAAGGYIIGKNKDKKEKEGQTQKAKDKK